MQIHAWDLKWADPIKSVLAQQSNIVLNLCYASAGRVPSKSHLGACAFRPFIVFWARHDGYHIFFLDVKVQKVMRNGLKNITMKRLPTCNFAMLLLNTLDWCHDDHIWARQSKHFSDSFFFLAASTRRHDCNMKSLLYLQWNDTCFYDQVFLWSIVLVSCSKKTVARTAPGSLTHSKLGVNIMLKTLIPDPIL